MRMTSSANVDLNGNAEARQTLAETYWDQGDDAVALPQYEVLSRLADNAPDKPGNGAVYYRYGVALKNAGKSAEAIGAYEKAYKADPKQADFAGAWRCRITPLQRGRSGTMQSQIVIRTTARGYEAIADGQRIPSVSVQGSRIHFAPSVASRDGRYYGGGIDLDLGDGGNTLEGSGRVRTTDGRNIQEMPASLSCYRLR